MLEIYRCKSPDKTIKYHFYFYTIVIDEKPIFELELANHKEVHIVPKAWTFILGKNNYRKVDFEKSDLMKYNNQRAIIAQYFGRLG